jgi:hypothetical protein
MPADNLNATLPEGYFNAALAEDYHGVPAGARLRILRELTYFGAPCFEVEAEGLLPTPHGDAKRTIIHKEFVARDEWGT